MRLRYQRLIEESEAELHDLERKLRGQAVADRVKMLRLLKSRAYRSRRTLAPVLGYSERQLQRWWDLYRAGGMTQLLEEKPVGGSREQMTEEAWAALRQALRAGTLTRLKDVQHYLNSRFGIEYTSLQGISDLLRRHQIDLVAFRRERDDVNRSA